MVTVSPKDIQDAEALLALALAELDAERAEILAIEALRAAWDATPAHTPEEIAEMVLLVARHGALLEILPAREARAQDLAEYVDRLKRLLALESLRGGRDAGGEPDAAVATLESIERTELARLAARLEGR